MPLRSRGVISGTGTAVLAERRGTTTLTGANTYSGGTFLNNGILAVSANNNLGAASGGLTFNGGTLRALADFNSTVRSRSTRVAARSAPTGSTSI